MPRCEVLYLVIPCYNEEEVLPETTRRLTSKLEGLIQQGQIDPRSKIVYVNDGSKDGTWPLIARLHRENPLVNGINLSRNRGHQNALLAGLMTVKDQADMVISMDADLQDDIDAIDRFIAKYYDGCDVVYGVRSARQTDSWFKRTTAQGFYKLMKFFGVDIVYNHADYRLMSRRALNELEHYEEVNLFLRGLVPLIGFRSDVVPYERHERVGRHYLLFHQAHPVYHRPWRMYFCHQPADAFVFSHRPLDGPYRRRVDFHHGLRLGHRRLAAFGHRHHRRIHRQNLYGNQKTASFYHRRIFAMTTPRVIRRCPV